MIKTWSPSSIAYLQKKILNWYFKNGRPLPWRKTKNPYYIWISEIMLQQTRVDAVLNYFPDFIRTFPTINDLATADSQDILRCWQGLGYYRRALNLHKTARMIQEEYQGCFPTDFQDIVALPGIGSYTAGAIASIAFNQAVPAIDGNIKRVIARIFYLTENINHPKSIQHMKKIIEKIISREHPGEFNQALMEIGATLCLPKKPRCTACPIRSDCLAAQKSKQEFLPVKNKKESPKQINVEIAIVKNKDRVLLIRRPANQMLAHMWGLPTIENNSEPLIGLRILKLIEKEFGITIKDNPIFLKNLQHIFTHRIWKMKLYLLYAAEKTSLPESRKIDSRWVNPEGLHNFPIPRAFQKCLEEYQSLSLVEAKHLH